MKQLGLGHLVIQASKTTSRSKTPILVLNLKLKYIMHETQMNRITMIIKREGDKDRKYLPKEK